MFESAPEPELAVAVGIKLADLFVSFRNLKQVPLSFRI